MHPDETRPKYKVTSTNVSFSRIDEPVSIYDFSDIIDTNEQSDFQIDHNLYSEEIQRRFLQAPAYVLTAGQPLDNRSALDDEMPGDTLTDTELANRKLLEASRAASDSPYGKELGSSKFRPRDAKGFKHPVLRHRSGSFLADQFTVRRHPETEEQAPADGDRTEQDLSKQKAVSVETFLQMLVPQPGYVPPMQFLFNCLLMMRQYIKTSDFMQHLTVSFLNACRQQNSRRRTISIPVHVHCTLYIVLFWIRKMPYDFRCCDLMQKTRELFALCISKFPPCFADVHFALKSLFMQLRRLEIYEEYLEGQNRLRLVDANLTIRDVCPDPSTLAEQLLILEADHLGHVGPEEYVQYLNAQKRVSPGRTGYASARDATAVGPSKRASYYGLRPKKDARLSRKFTFNLEAYIRWVNRLSYYITTEIVRHPRRRTRAANIEYFIDVAQRCLQLNNFNSTMGVISGLDDAAVKRLRRTWQRVSTSHQTRFRYFQSLMSVSSNFATYRSAVANVLTKSRENFYVPFLCVSLKDIYYINEVMPDTVNGALINLEKVEKMGTLVAELARLGQTAQTEYYRLEDVLRFLHAAQVFDSITAMQVSSKHESDVDS